MPPKPTIDSALYAELVHALTLARQILEQMHPGDYRDYLFEQVRQKYDAMLAEAQSCAQ